MKIWLDDVREPPDSSWEWARTESDLWVLLISLPPGERPELISFDHDLGEGQTDGYQIIKDLATFWDHRYPERIIVHSDNGPGADNIVRYDAWYRRMIAE